MFARRFNAIGVELFPRKHGYSEGIHGGLRLESATHMALKRSFYIMIYISSCPYSWRIALRKRNTYSVETFISLRDLYHFASQFASFYLVFCIISSHDLRQITTAIHINKEMMHFTPQNKGEWIATLPSTNRIDNTRIIHPILNLIVTFLSTNRINNRGKGKEQYK